jgi:hypothetical protein
MWWVAAALAEQVAVESLAWKTWDADAVVRASLTEVVAADGEVHVRIDEVVHGPSPGEGIEVRWPAGPGRQDLWPGAEVLLFLRRGEDGRWSLREGPGGVVDLAHPAGASAVTADCGVVATGDEVLAAVRAYPSRPASLGSTVAWPLGPPARYGCEVDTAAFAASWQGSGVDVLVPPDDLAALATPHLRVESLSERRAWFGVGALSVEWVGCVVGVADGLPPVVECAFPGGSGEGERPPVGLKGAARAAARATRAALGPGTRVVRMVYQATEQRAWLCAGEWTPAGWSEGSLPFGVDGGVARLAEAAMTSSGRGSLRGCVGRDLAWPLPAGVAPLERGRRLDGGPRGGAPGAARRRRAVRRARLAGPVGHAANAAGAVGGRRSATGWRRGGAGAAAGRPDPPGVHHGAVPGVGGGRAGAVRDGARGGGPGGLGGAGGAPGAAGGGGERAVVEVVAGAPEERLAVWSVGGPVRAVRRGAVSCATSVVKRR